MRANDVRDGRPADAGFNVATTLFHDVPPAVAQTAQEQERGRYRAARRRCRRTARRAPDRPRPADRPRRPDRVLPPAEVTAGARHSPREPATDLAGVTGVRTGEDSAAELYAACYPRLVGVLALAAGSRSEAEDVVQEAFVRLVPRWSSIGRYDDPEAWVRKVAFRLLSHRFRQLRRLGRPGPHRDDPTLPAPDSARLDVARGLATLPLAQRQVVVLHYLLDRPVAEVAADLGVAVGTVKSRLSRARAALAPLLEDPVDDHA